MIEWVKLLAPVRDRKRFFALVELCRPCRETGKEPPPSRCIQQVLTALRGYGEPIVLPRLSDQLIRSRAGRRVGAGGRHIAKDKALAHVAGYTCGNDVRREDWQNNKPASNGCWVNRSIASRHWVRAGDCGRSAGRQRLRICLRIDGPRCKTADVAIDFRCCGIVSYIWECAR